MEMSVIAEPIRKERSESIVEPSRKLWTQEEFYRLCDAGFFRGQRVELVDGEFIVMSPAGAPHDGVVHLVAKILEKLFGENFTCRIQVGLEFAADTEPQPDVLVATGTVYDYLTRKPTTAVLVVEVSDTSLRYDCGVKMELYAQHGIPEYWVLDLKGRRLIVHRDPGPDPSRARGFAYKSVLVLDEKQSIAPLGAPAGVVAVADLLP
jgi:Uma2 family endonuclease